MFHGRGAQLALFFVLLSAPVVWLYQPASAGQAESVVVVEAPSVELVYSSVEPTNQSVTVSLQPDAPITILNNGGHAQKVMTENGKFTFHYRDEAGRAYSAEARVENIDTAPPEATITPAPENDVTVERAMFAVGGEDVWQYRYALDEGGFSASLPVAQAIVLEEVSLGLHTLRVIGLDAAGNWQPHSLATDFTWTQALRGSSESTVRARQVPLSQGQKMIEVSIGDQHLWAYDGETLVIESAITTGANGMNTRVGSFAISQMHENKWFDGGFFSDYWMRFDGGIGIHDATWRTAFGSQNYKTTGSHGCVNTPFEVAEWLYGWAEVGTGVTVY